jgi:hypothetical protein
MTAIRVEVTAADIAAGVRRFCSYCPVSLAVRRATGWLVQVDDDEVHLRVGDLTSRVKLPPEAVRFVWRFDEGKPVKPFAFEIPDPRPEAP